MLEDARAWKECLNKNSREAYKEYLSKFPNGRHAKEAKAKVVSFDDKSGRGCLWYIFIVFAIVCFIDWISKESTFEEECQSNRWDEYMIDEDEDEDELTIEEEVIPSPSDPSVSDYLVYPISL